MSRSPALRLARRLAALPEQAMRERALRELVLGEPPEQAVALLAELQRRGRSGGPPFSIALRALVGLLGREALPYARQVALYQAAKAAEQTALMQLFYSHPGPDQPAARSGEGERRELTLGHRKWLARGASGEQLQRLLHDPEPEVVINLLANPRLTEEELVRMIARRPIDSAVLRVVSESSRWIARYRIKRALVLNPHTPTEIGVRLLGFLTRADLRLVQRSPDLSPRLHEAARVVVEDH
jgi:hypothetical protein